MAQIKFTASISLTIIHPDGVKPTKKAVARYVREKLQAPHYVVDMQHGCVEVVKAVVRDVDKD